MSFKPDLQNIEKLFQDLIFNQLKLQETTPIDHLQDTPKRIAKMLVNELFRGCYDEPPTITTFPNDQEDHQVVCVDSIEVKSMCSHHFMPFYGKAKICYIPGNEIAGLSKFARVLDYFARRPQVQEVLGKQVVEYIWKQINPLAIGIRMRCTHLCMVHRGAKNNAEMVTQFVKAQNRDLELELIQHLEL